MIRILFLVLLAALWAGNHFLGWRFWVGIAGVAVLLMVFGRTLAEALFYRLAKMPFKMKGAVLRGAGIELHRVTALTTDGVENAYEVELTIMPAGEAETPFQLWEPDSLAILTEDANAQKMDDPEEYSAGTVEKVEVLSEGKWESEGMKYPGEQRVRLHLQLDQPRASVRLGYYFEVLPAISLMETESVRQ